MQTPTPTPAAANALGILGATCWSIQLLPQIIINHRRHHTTGLQPSMMLLWACAGIPLGVFNIVQNLNLALRIQAQILTGLSLVTCSQCYYYACGWSWQKCLLCLGCLALLMGAVEAALIIALRIGVERGVTWPVTLMAVLAASLLAAGVLRHYWDIYTHRTVRGISFIFVGIDAAGDFFSLLSILFQAKLDVLGMAIYGVELVLWIGVFVCGGFFNLAPWVRARVSRSRGQIGEHRQGVTSSTSLHSMPSSTSVFRTPGGGLIERGGNGAR